VEWQVTEADAAGLLATAPDRGRPGVPASQARDKQSIRSELQCPRADLPDNRAVLHVEVAPWRSQIGACVSDTTGGSRVDDARQNARSDGSVYGDAARDGADHAKIDLCRCDHDARFTAGEGLPIPFQSESGH